MEMFDGTDKIEEEGTIGYLSPSEDFIANAKLGVRDAEEKINVISSIYENALTTLRPDLCVSGGLSSIRSSWDDCRSAIQADENFLEENKEAISEYVSNAWYIEKLQRRKNDVSNALDVIVNEKIDIDTTELRLKLKEIHNSIDNLQRRQFVISTTRPDIVAYVERSYNAKLQAVDLYPYERLAEYINNYLYYQGITRPYITTQGTISNLSSAAITRNYIVKNLKAYPIVHGDDPGPKGVCGYSGDSGVFVPDKFLE